MSKQCRSSKILEMVLKCHNSVLISVIVLNCRNSVFISEIVLKYRNSVLILGIVSNCPVQCPHVKGSFIHNSIEGVLIKEVSLFQGCPYRGIPLYIVTLTIQCISNTYSHHTRKITMLV